MARVVLAILALGVSLLAGVGLGRWQPDDTQLIFLDVGQGDCTIFRTAGRTILIDVGPPGSPTFRTGERVVAPELRKLGVSKLDLVLLTHPDDDHIGGLSELAQRIPISRVAASAAFKDHSALEEELEYAGIPSEQVIWLNGEQTARLGDFTMQVLTPPWSPPQDDNQGSLFIRLCREKASAVFTGDADSLTELIMLSRATGWKSQVLKVGHHGSRSSTGRTWLAHTQPLLAVISCGRTNSYGHPHPELLKRLSDLKLQPLRTDRDGTIRLRVNNGRFERYP